MKKVHLIMLFTFLYTALSAQSQRIGNYTLEGIGKQVVDPGNKYYYPNLLEAFKKDAPLEDDALLMLYYGFSTQSAYKPYETWLLEKELIKLEVSQEPQKAISLADSLLKIYPVSILAQNKLYRAYRAIDDKTAAMKHKALFETLAKAIEISSIKNSTDIGKKIETATYLISFGDKYPYFQYLGRTPKPKEEYFEQYGQQYNLVYYANPASPVIANKWYFNTSILCQKDSRLIVQMEEWVSEVTKKK